VLGGGPHAADQALLIRQWSDDVILFANANPVSDAARAKLAARDIPIVEGSVTRVIVRDDHVYGLELGDQHVILRTAVFVQPRLLPNSDLLTRLGCRVDEHGWVEYDTAGQTSVPGVRVAGNAADPKAQVITAAGQGSAVAIEINAELVGEDVRRALADRNAA